ncbi:relaxase/mobilization nuclease domain-containing protein [Algoriphagus halophytocola]|uniref:Relaxase/mobilization nuclease domain-containing protein n=1 Tax=Algoriphagus halophytocola TaxID=2991499 RepID=A0ABY6MIC4_9BACT|nr:MULTISPECIES: relaxase/mobilization nuclease domain-containing protein [unclassified Algoriphagus]UZD23541.1 relaxase/mobilization nuclease domain-containing protein [Algoriphagus sp. TR-M5]WBL44835.1 relaxase/mobilization nuclease domain-containing protein [Algoriphagus sp. TR-M9]
MITKVSIGTSFMGALNYNLQKLYSKDESQKAELLATNFASLKQQSIKNELRLLQSLNPRLKRNTFHTSLNFGKDEVISNDKMLTIAEEYIKKMGFDNNAYFIFRHHDTGHPHCHILVLRNRFDGTVVSDSRNYQRSDQIARELEIKYNLEQVKSSQESKVKSPDKDEIEMALRTGKASQRIVLQELVGAALKKSNNIPSFIGHLEKSGVYVLFNQASTGRVSGISYCYGGFVAKGQALGNQFKWGQVSKTLHYEQAKDLQSIDEANHRTRAAYPKGENDYSAGKSTVDRMSNRTAKLPESNLEESKNSSRSNPFESSNHSFETRSTNKETDFGNDREPENLPSSDQGSTNSFFHAPSAIASLGDLLAAASTTGNVNDDSKRKKKKEDKNIGIGR